MNRCRQLSAIMIAVALPLVAVLMVLVMLPSSVGAAPDELTLRPSGDVTVTLDILGSTPALTNWESVDEATSDVDITYVWGDTSAYTGDLYTLGDVSSLSGKGPINSVTVYVRCRTDLTKSGIGARTWIRTNSVDDYGSDISLTSTYSLSSTQYLTNPQTTITWTWAEVNALEAGVQVQKVLGDGVNCTQVYVVVDYTPVTSWISYSDSDHLIVCDSFSGSTNHVYMYGGDFARGTTKVGYYDALGDLAETDIYLSFVGGTLSSDCILNQDWGGSPPAGNDYWDAVVIQTSDTMPSTYALATAHTNYVIDDAFYVTTEAIPEFPTVIAGIVVAGTCFGIYYWMRKRKVYGVHRVG